MNYDTVNSTPLTLPNSTLSNMNITKPLYYITVQTNSTTSVNLTSLILTNLFIEVNNSNSLIPSGTYCYKFSNSVVSNQFLYTSLNNLYNQLYQSNIISTVFPGTTGYIGY